MFNIDSNTKFDMDVTETVSVYDEKLAIVSSNSHNLTVNSIASLKNMKVSVVKNSKISNLLKEYGIDVKEYKSLDELLSSINKTSILAIDLSSYEVYSKSVLKNYKIDYITNTNYEYG